MCMEHCCYGNASAKEKYFEKYVWLTRCRTRVSKLFRLSHLLAGLLPGCLTTDYMDDCSLTDWVTRLQTGKVTLKQATQGLEGSRSVALLILDLGARWGWVVSATPRSLYPRERHGIHVQEAGWTPRPVWTCAKNLAVTGIRSPVRPVRSQSLYRLSYPVHNYELVHNHLNKRAN
jgi:hypothetical protein